MERSRFTDAVQRRQYNVFPAKIIKRERSTITFQYRDKTDVLKERTVQLYNTTLQPGDCGDFREYAISNDSTVLEYAGRTPEAFIPAWAR